MRWINDGEVGGSRSSRRTKNRHGREAVLKNVEDDDQIWKARPKTMTPPLFTMLGGFIQAMYDCASISHNSSTKHDYSHD